MTSFLAITSLYFLVSDCNVKLGWANIFQTAIAVWKIIYLLILFIMLIISKNKEIWKWRRGEKKKNWRENYCKLIDRRRKKWRDDKKCRVRMLNWKNWNAWKIPKVAWKARTLRTRTRGYYLKSVFSSNLDRSSTNFFSSYRVALGYVHRFLIVIDSAEKFLVFAVTYMIVSMVEVCVTIEEFE